MERMFICVTILWLGALNVAHAQVSPQVSPLVDAAPGTTVPSASVTAGATPASSGGVGLTETPCATFSSSVIGAAAPALGCGSDPLSTPSSTIPTEISPGGFTTGSAGSAAGSSSTSPQTARQLPGEAANSTTKAPAATTASPSVAPSTTLCAPAIPSASGVSSPGSLFGAMSSSGC
jgi:hypothetical protein